MKKDIIKKTIFWFAVIAISIMIYVFVLKTGHYNYDENLIILRLCIAYLSNIILLFGIGRILYLLE